MVSARWMLALSLALIWVAPGAAVAPKRYMVLGTWGHGAGAATPEFVDAAVDAGFNAVRVTANWGYMEQAPGVIDWALLDNQTAYIHDVAKLPLAFNIWCQRYHPDAVVGASGMGEDQTGAGGVSNATWSISFANETALAAAMRFVTSVVQRYGRRYPDTLSFSVVFDGYSETEFFPGAAMLEPGSFDFSRNARAAFRSFLETKYHNSSSALSKAWGLSPALPNFAAAQPPDNPADNETSQQDLDWYLARELMLGKAVQRIRQTVKAVDGRHRVAVQFGSVFDGAIRNRALINFPCIAKGIDVVWVDDSEGYPHAFAMDYLRSNLAPGTWLANEIDAPSRGTDSQYYHQAAMSYSHGCTMLSVANWQRDSLVNRSTLFTRIAKDFLQAPTPPPPPVEGAMNISAMSIFKAGMVPNYRPPKYGGGMVPEYQRLSRQGELWLDVKLLRDLGHQPLCDGI